MSIAGMRRRLALRTAALSVISVAAIGVVTVIPNGTYCSVTWRKNPSGATTRIASECVGIGVTQIG